MASSGAEKQDISDSIKKLNIDNEDDFESPFKWYIPEIPDHQSNCIIAKMSEKINCAVDDGKAFIWFRYTKPIILIYEHIMRNESQEALKYVKMCEQILAEPPKHNLAAAFFLSIQKSLLHVFLATKLWMAKHDIITDVDCTKLKKEITPFNSMNNEERAGVLGIKTAIFMGYGPEIGSYMLETIREAIQLSPNQAEWHYREGVLLKRQRKSTGGNNQDRSQLLKSFKKAYELNPQNASYVLKYASELKHVGFHMDENLDEHVYHEHWNEVVCLYNKTLELRPDCPYTLAHIAKGFKSFPSGYRDYEKMKRLLLKAKERAPKHNLILHDLAWFYKHVDRDLEASAKYFKEAFDEGAYGATYAYIRTKLQIDPSFDPIPILESQCLNFFEKDRKAESLIHLGCYYFFVKNDINSALKQFSEVLELYAHSNFLKRVNPCCIHVKGGGSILELLHNTLNEEHRNVPQRDEILKKVYEIDPHLQEEPTHPRPWNNVEWRYIRRQNVNRERTQNNFFQRQRNSNGRNWRNTSPPPEGSWRR